MRLIVQMRGLDTLSLGAKYLSQAAQVGLKLGVSEGAGIVETEEKTVVAVDSGNLRDAIHTEVVEDSPERQVRAVTPVYPADNKYGFDPAYARRIEEGFIGTDSLGRVYHQAPEPYVRPAWDATHEQAGQAIRDGINDQMDAAMSKVAGLQRGR